MYVVFCSISYHLFKHTLTINESNHRIRERKGTSRRIVVGTREESLTQPQSIKFTVTLEIPDLWADPEMTESLERGIF